MESHCDMLNDLCDLESGVRQSKSEATLMAYAILGAKQQVCYLESRHCPAGMASCYSYWKPWLTVLERTSRYVVAER